MSAFRNQRIVQCLSEGVGAAALGEISWQNFCSLIVELFPAAYAAIIDHDFSSGRVEFAAANGICESSVDSYLNYYASVNPWRHFWERAPNGAIIVSERDDPASRYMATEFYNDWMRPAGDFDAAVGLRIQVDARETIYLPVHYSLKLAGLYDSALEHVMRELRAPIINACTLAKLIREAGERQSIASVLSGRMNEIAVVIDSEMRVREASDGASRAFSNGSPISCFRNRLRLSDAVVEKQLGRWFNDTEQSAKGQFTSFILRTVPGLWKGSIHSIPQMRIEPLRAARMLYLLRLEEVVCSKRTDTRLLATAFGLTPAECGLCQSLAKGNRLEVAAMDNCVSYENARQRLKTIFHKVGVRSQVELVAVLHHF